MRFINKGRQTGKTTMMIHSAYTTGYPIITTTYLRKDLILQQAHEMNCDGIDVYTVEEWTKLRNHTNAENNVFVDETEDLLKKILNEYLDANVVAATLSLPMNDIKKCEDNDVRHGYWHLLDECANDGVYCSECHKKIYKIEYANQKIKSKYCPNCGAIMDLEEK